MTIASAALLLFLILDPLGNIPVFLSLLRPLPGRRRRIVLVRELLIALFVLMAFLWGGKFVLDLMLNKDWGQVDTVGFFGTRRLANVTGVQNGQYIYDLGTATKPTWQNLGIYDTYTNPARVVSRWSALLTVKYTF